MKIIDSPILGDFKINLNTKNYIDSCIYFMGDYEAYLKKHFKLLIKPGDVVFDIGANIGFHTLFFAELTGNLGKVFSFEPIELNYTSLIKNIEVNPLINIEPINIALGNKNEKINIFIDPNQTNPGAFSLNESGIKNTTVSCVRGDDFIKEYKIHKVDLLKIDVEGFEFEVLKGLSESIQKFKPIIFFEYDRNYQIRAGNNPIDIFNFLSRIGYHFFKIDGYANKTIYQFSEDTIGAEILAIPSQNLLVDTDLRSC